MKIFLNDKRQGFTLIELLVVISIIGLLSSVVLASLSTARSKAQVAAGKQFDISHYSAWGADALAYWSMDSISSGKVKDLSGNSLDLTVSATPTVTPGIMGNAISITGSGQSLSLTVPANSKLANITTTGGTITVWVNNNSLSSARYISAVYGGSTNRIYIALSNSEEIILYRGSNVSDTINLGKIKTGEWYNVGFSWTGGSNPSSQIMKGYLNGKKIAERSFTNTGTIGGANFRIGDHPSGYTFIGGLIDEYRIYNNVLADSQIRDNYFAELEKIKGKLASE